jgi:hypothetical protein
MASIDHFRVWILATTSNQTLMQQSKCHQARQRPNSTSTQQAHRTTHALHEKTHS